MTMDTNRIKDLSWINKTMMDIYIQPSKDKNNVHFKYYNKTKGLTCKISNNFTCYLSYGNYYKNYIIKLYNRID